MNQHICTNDQIEGGCEWLHEDESQLDKPVRSLFAPCQAGKHERCREITNDEEDGEIGICGCVCHHQARVVGTDYAEGDVVHCPECDRAITIDSGNQDLINGDIHTDAPLQQKLIATYCDVSYGHQERNPLPVTIKKRTHKSLTQE